jgi:hypothetical protein
MEERRWMQMVGRVYPVTTYLRRIDKHPTGDCPWGCKDAEGMPVKETLCHFQSECKHFKKNRTLAHNDIARATMAALKDMHLTNWKFFYETALEELPFKFKWADDVEEERQRRRRPDGVAWNAISGEVVFMEFTRAMDNPDNMAVALARKGHQYDKAVEALTRAQNYRSTKHSSRIAGVSTAPLIFGVRGTVMIDEARESLRVLGLTEAQLKRALATGVRAAITAASDMCTARTAALKCLPGIPRGADGKRVKTHIPQKPFKAAHWRRDRGSG